MNHTFAGGVAGVLGAEPQGLGPVPDALQALLLLQAHRAAAVSGVDHQQADQVPPLGPVQGLPPLLRAAAEDVEPDSKPELLHVRRGGGARMAHSGSRHSVLQHGNLPS